MNIDRMKAIYYGYRHDTRMNAVVDSKWLAGLRANAQRMARYAEDPDSFKGRFVQMREGGHVARLRRPINGASTHGTWRVEFMDGPRRGEFAVVNVLSDTTDLSPLEELAWAEKLYADAG